MKAEMTKVLYFMSESDNLTFYSDNLDRRLKNTNWTSDQNLTDMSIRPTKFGKTADISSVRVIIFLMPPKYVPVWLIDYEECW